MIKEVKIMYIVSYFIKSDIYNPLDLMDSLSVDITELTNLIELTREEGLIYYSDKPITIYYDDSGEFNNNISVTSKGEYLLDDDKNNSRLFLLELRKDLKNDSVPSQPNYLPYLPHKEYQYIINYINNNDYVTTVRGEKMAIMTKSGLIINSNLVITDKGNMFILIIGISHSSTQNLTINNYGQMSQSIGSHSQSTFNNDSFDSFRDIDDLLDYLENDISKRDLQSVIEYITEIHENPENKESIFQKFEQMLNKYPKLSSLVKASGTLLITNWSNIKNFLGL